MRSIELIRTYVTPEFKAPAAEIRIDGNRNIVLVPGMEFIVPGTEITEENISSIELAASSSYNRDRSPLGGTAKWFRDEMGQTWVKFQRTRSQGRVYWEVWPADRVVCVTYDDRPVEG